MTERYVEIDSQLFEQFLSQQKFERTVSSGNEVVYESSHKDDKFLKTKVYTSIKVGETSARDCGTDAIRVVVIWDNNQKSFPIGKFSRVYRTGSQAKVHERVSERLNQASIRCNEWLEERRAKFAKSNNDVANQSQYVGKLGEVIQISIDVITRMPWKDKFLFTMKDQNSNQFVYWSDKDLLQVGEKYDLKCKVKGFNTFRNVKQTEISDCIGKRVVM